MKRITFFINSLEVGGTEKQLLQLVKELENKFTIDIFCFRKGKLYNAFLKQKVNIISGSNNLLSFLMLINYLFKNKSDIYHFFLPKTYIVCSFLTIFSKKKKIMSRRSLNFYHNKYWKVSLYIEKFLHNFVDYLVCNAFEIKKQLIQDEDVDEKKIRLIKNFFIPLPKVKEKNIKRSKNKISFAYIANLIPYKGHTELINTCSKLKTKRNWTLYLAGNGSANYLKKLRDLVSEKKMGNRIIFLGLIKDIHLLYQEMDFIINTSFEEGSSNTLLEALSAKLPILCFDVGGNEDFINKINKNGFLIQYKNYDELREKLTILIDSNKKQEMGRNSYKHFKENFNNKLTLRQHLKLYE